ncbi:hypothetical protein N7528_006766 [Penicillium herquei]|nr:hypothetical protein N7528_006766 [Penicillium herquei]
MIFSADLSSIADSEEGRTSLESSPSPIDLSFSHKENSRSGYLLAGGTSDSMVDKSTETPVQSPEIKTPRLSLSPIVQSIEEDPAEIIAEPETAIKDEDPPTPRPIPSASPSPSSYSSPSPQSSIATTESQSSAETPEPLPSVERAKSQTPMEDEDGGPLDIYTAKRESELVTVLHLITDSIAKQRELATKSILYNPIYWIMIIVLFDYIYRILYYDDVDWIIIVVAWSAALMCTRHGAKIWVNGYIDEAERVGRWSWLFGNEWIKHFDSDRYRYSFLDSSGGIDWRDLVWVSLKEIWVRVPGGDVRYAEQWLESRREGDTKDDRPDREDPARSVGGSGIAKRGKSDWEKYSDGERIQVAASSLKATDDLGIEGLSDGWLRDMVFVARFKGRIIGALVMRAIPVDMDVVGTAHASGPLSSAMGQYVPGHVYRWKAVIRAWNVEEEYRGFGVGRNILQYAIEHTVDRGWDGPEFAVDHANSLRILPAFLNGKMDRMEKRAKKRLVKEIETYKCVIWNT